MLQLNVIKFQFLSQLSVTFNDSTHYWGIFKGLIKHTVENNLSVDNDIMSILMWDFQKLMHTLPSLPDLFQCPCIAIHMQCVQMQFSTHTPCSFLNINTLISIASINYIMVYNE